MYNTTNILNGTVTLKGDKSLSHRLLMITSLIADKSILKNISTCRDVSTTISCLEKCNIDIVYQDNCVSICGGTLQSPESVLDCENSGSTLRMLIGLLSGQYLSASFDGDQSLKSRPMNRIINPLKNMGVSIISNDGKLPLHIKTKDIKAINYLKKTKSAQVKTALIFASLGSNKWSNISYNKFTRDHTEQIMNDIGFNITINTHVKVKKTQINKGINVSIPGDISSAAFIIAAAILLPDSDITIKNVLYNKNRLIFIEMLVKMGAIISIKNISSQQHGMQSCDINAKYSKVLCGISIKGDEIISMIDEIPIFCVVASFSKGISSIVDAKELRHKESDRIHAICDNLSNMGANIYQGNDTITIKGFKKLYNASINHYNDHRIAMAFEIMKLSIGEKMSYEHSDIIDISFPKFYETIDSLIQ